MNLISNTESEFGSGIVVCLAKFSEHLWNDMFNRLHHLDRWLKMTEDERRTEQEEATKYPHGDASKRMESVQYARLVEDIYGSPEKVLSNQIMMWMNGASDHFYDLDERAPAPLKELASLTLKIGHGFLDDTWTMDHVDQIRRLWKESCLAVDEMLGIKSDWGQW